MLSTRSGPRSPSPIERKGALETPWRALGRGSLPPTARYLLQMLTGNTTTKGLECFHLREGSRKSTWSSSSHLKLRFLERAHWFHEHRRSGFQTVLQEATLKENQTSSSGSSKKLIFHLNGELQRLEFHHLHVSPLCTLSCSYSSLQGDLPFHLKSLHPSWA